MPEINEPTIALDVLRPTVLHVDLARLTANYQLLRQHAGVPVLVVLKANAYGHGLVEVGRHFDLLGAPYLGVAYLEEGLRLRQAGVRVPILVMGGIVGEQIPLFVENDLTLTASSVDKLNAIESCASALGRTAHVHLKIDTGMERIGVHWYSAGKLLEVSLRCPHVIVDGVFSHFASADAEDLRFARLQLERFLEVLDFYRMRSLPPPTRHISSSGAVLQMPEAHLDMVRPGVLLYGAYPSPQLARAMDVRPALRWTSHVVYFKVVQPGAGVSYGSTWKPEAQVRVVTLPVGYGDGYMRCMSGQAQVVIRGQRYPVVGRICMDQVMVNLGWDSAFNGDEVLLLGGTGATAISIEEMARWAGTIPHEILTSINTRVPRVYSNRLPDQNGQKQTSHLDVST
jgi:alanine racemase